MFDLKSWVSGAVIAAYRGGQYGDIDVAVLTANYVSRGLLTTDDAAAIAQATVAPQILVQPQGASVQAGSALTLRVQATGAAPLAYQWAKDGQAIAGATDSTYTIPGLQAADTGGYAVTVRNSAGSVTSAIAQASVFNEPAQG